ncbi:MAG: GNAT family N-acetyltransferase [Bacteroidota bacterium]|nr:GNAT family N-acetyltransferase [Bacteroidota bacterium]
MNIRLANNLDINAITDLHCISFTIHDHVPMMLGRNYVKSTYRWLINSNQSYVLVSIIDNEIAGVVAVCDGPFTKPMFIACLPSFIRSILISPNRLFNRLLWNRLFRKAETPEGHKLENLPGFAQMTIGIVDPKHRGKGVFSKLIEETKNQCRTRGSKLLRAGIYKVNNSSRKTFINAGWPELKQLETSDTVFYAAFITDEYYSLFF